MQRNAMESGVLPCFEEEASGTASVWLSWEEALLHWASLVSRMSQPSSHGHAVVVELKNQAPRKMGA